jgi:predicted nucleic acid-binding protein
VIYRDSSAIVKLVHREAESSALIVGRRPEWPLVSSALAAVEVHRAVRRYAPEVLPGVPAVMARLYLLEIDAVVRETAAALPDTAVRSLNAIHIASALVLQAEEPALGVLVGYDQRLLRNAANAGLRVLSPGSVGQSGGS